MATRVRLCVLLLAILESTFAFNFAPMYARIVSEPNMQARSHFGQSVALRVETDDTGSRKPWMVVGAPRGNSTYPEHINLVRPGVTYICEVSGAKSCIHLVLDTSGNISYKTIKINSDKENSGIGSAIDVEDSKNDLVVCGPGWTNHYKESYYMNGMCYWLKNTKYPQKKQFELYSLLNKNNQGVLIGGFNKGLYAYAQMGFSVHFVKGKNEFLTGAPGFLDWRGSVLRHHYKPGKDRLTSDIQSWNSAKNMPEFGYFGYSVSSGKLSSPNTTSYVSGAPRAANYKGKVYVFDFEALPGSDKTDEPEYHLNILKEREGTQMGEYFGASLCVADLNQDGLDDLLVGAPQHSLASQTTTSASGDEGCVYIFINDAEYDWKDMGEKCPISGSEVHSARFGTAISVIGDVNMDGYPDIAIGAPYENGGGAIYIYHGNVGGLNLKYSQRITAEEINPYLRGFGISISKGVDIDDNHYQDIAVGSYLSGHAVLLKTYPVISIHPIVTANVGQIGLNDLTFVAHACFSYSGKFSPNKTEVQVTLRIDPTYKRASFIINELPTKVYIYNATLEFGIQMCKNLTVKIEQGSSDYNKPIDLTLEYKLPEPKSLLPLRAKRHIMEDQSDNFCKSCPVMDPNQNKPVFLKVPYATGCKLDSNCMTDLSIEANLTNIKPPFIIGSSKSLNLSIAVTNIGEAAFLAKVSVIMPQITPFLRIPKKCQENDTESVNTLQLICDLDNPLWQNMTRRVEIELDMSNVPPEMKELQFNISTYSSAGTELDPSDNRMLLTLPLIAVADVVITGKSSQDQIIYASNKNSSSNESIAKNKEFSHIYMVMNDGPSPVTSVNLEFKIPVRVYTEEKTVEVLRVYEPLSYLGNQPFLCKHISGPSYYSDMITTEVGNRREDEEEKDQMALVRRRRLSDDKDNPPTNRTLFVDCLRSDTECMTVHCTVGPLPAIRSRVEVEFKMVALLKHLGPLLGRRDIMLVTSSGSVKLGKMSTATQPSNDKPDQITIQTVFWGTLPEGKLSTWVLAVSIAGGLLILMLIILALIKFGFFKREKQIQLQAMKQKSLVDDDDMYDSS